MTALLFVMGLSAIGILVLCWHFFARFKLARHPFSVVAGLAPAGWLFALAMALSPAMAHWRPILSALALVVGILGVVLAWLDRRNRAALEALQKRLGGNPKENHP